MPAFRSSSSSYCCSAELIVSCSAGTPLQFYSFWLLQHKEGKESFSLCFSSASRSKIFDDTSTMINLISVQNQVAFYNFTIVSCKIIVRQSSALIAGSLSLSVWYPFEHAHIHRRATTNLKRCQTFWGTSRTDWIGADSPDMFCSRSELIHSCLLFLFLLTHYLESGSTMEHLCLVAFSLWAVTL